ncbi:MAG: type I restriction endonuclease subunit R, partial [Bacteroidota bacterium]
WTNSGLFQFVQLFVISNGVNTKYYANNPITTLTFRQTFFWAKPDNRSISNLTDFASTFLDPAHLGRMIAQYVVLNETHKILMVLRPYQFHAVEAITAQVKKGRENGYIWHTTGSGKTLTSFKASQIVMNMPEVEKVVFVVDRKDLDYQTANEFNSFKDGCVDMTEDTKSLVKQFQGDAKLIVTTIQKLNNAISKTRYEKKIGHLRLSRIVFIFDECHRSQFGETHKRITGYFANSQLFGFTGTPIFAENAFGSALGKRTTRDLFGECLHKYVITDAIKDQNVLKFSVEYIGRYKKKNNTLMDIEVEDIDKREILTSDQRLDKIADYIIRYHGHKTHQKTYSAIFTVSDIDTLIRYYDRFAEKKALKEHDLRIATIFSYAANPEDPEAQGLLPPQAGSSTDAQNIAAETQDSYGNVYHRDKLDEFISDYNRMFGTSFSTRDSKSFENYYKDLSKRLKDREKASFNEKDRVDILLVVNMFLTGFDAKKVNTLYVDKNLRYHGLVQAFSRTNRILNEQKSQGNILCFRNLKTATDEAIALFSNKEAKEVIFTPPYEELVRRFDLAFSKLRQLAPTVDSVNDLPSEEEELEFVKAFRELMRLRNVLMTHTEFSWSDLPMSEQLFADYASKYLDLRDKVRQDRQKDKASVLEEIDFEVELIHRDEVNVAYILRLLAKLKQARDEERERQYKEIMDLIGGEVELRSKRELIEKFIQEHLPNIDDVDQIEDAFMQFWMDEKVLAIQRICEEEGLDQAAFGRLVDAYVFSGREPLRDDILKCLETRPSILKARGIAERVLERMRGLVEVFVGGMVG